MRLANRGPKRERCTMGHSEQCERDGTHTQSNRDEAQKLAPQIQILEARGHRASSTPDLVISNEDSGMLTVRKEGIWAGASGHSTMILEVPRERLEKELETKRRTSKTALNGMDRRNMAKAEYAKVIPSQIKKADSSDGSVSPTRMQGDNKGNPQTMADVYE